MAPLVKETRESAVLPGIFVSILSFTPRDGGLSYIKFAEQRGASYFDIGTDAWNTATQTERLAANQHVLDIAIKNKRHHHPIGTI